MSNIFNEDFQNFLATLDDHHVKYILVEGFSELRYNSASTKGDMDIWLERSLENYRRFIKAFSKIRMSTFDMIEKYYYGHPGWEMYTISVPPLAIDVILKITGLNFQECFENSVVFEHDNLKIRTIQIDIY